MASFTTDLPGSVKLQWPPEVYARTSEGGMQQSAFRRSTFSSTDLDHARFNVGGRGATLHSLIGAYHAGDVWGPLTAQYTISGDKKEQSPLLVGAKGYHTQFMSPDFLGRRSRNMVMKGGHSIGRFGYKLLSRGLDAQAAAYTGLFPAIEADGTYHAVLINGTNLYEDKAVPAAPFTIDDAWAVGRPWSWQNVRGRWYAVNGTSAIMAYYDGAAWQAQAMGMADPDTNPVLTSPVDGTSTLTAGTYFVRIRGYDSKTGTYSGPQNRTGAAGSHTVASGDRLDVDITAVTFDSRCDFWEVQIATEDLPDAYLRNTTLGPGSDGLIAIATTTASIVADPEGAAFDFRDVAGVQVYRHANVPGTPSILAWWRGRMFYASHAATYLYWADPSNPEHFYTSSTDPTQGLNTADAENMTNGIHSPVTALGPTKEALYIFGRGTITAAEGSWVLSPNGADRDSQIHEVVVNGHGAVSPGVQQVDNAIFYLSPSGPAVISGGQAQLIYPANIQGDWQTRDIDNDVWAQAVWDPNERQLWFAYSQGKEANPILDKALVFDLDEAMWSAPFDIHAASLTLMRYVNDAAAELGNRVVAGIAHGDVGVYGLEAGDGLAADSALAAKRTSTANTTTLITDSTASYSAGALRNISVALLDRDDGRVYYRVISTNNVTQIQFVDPVPASTLGFYFWIGGIPREAAIAFPKGDHAVHDAVTVAYVDVPAIYERS
jgi:hypothetical protein